MKKKKIVFGLENILIGNLKYLLAYKSLIKIIIDSCNHKKIKGDLCQIDKDLWKKNISPEFFRPFLKEFLHKYKSSYDFYIYSSNTSSIISLEIVEIIEKFMDISFKRPILSKENLYINSQDKYEKDLSHLSSYIIIDDKEMYKKDLKIISPSLYKYTYIPVVDSHILSLLRKMDIKNFIILPEIFTDNYDEFYFNYHLFTAQLYKSVLNENKENMKDDFLNKISLSNKNINA